MSNLEDQIVDILNTSREPISTEEILNELSVSKTTLRRALDELETTNKICRVGAPRYAMWMLSKNNDGTRWSDIAKINQDLNEVVANARGTSNELESKIANLEEKINKFYVDIIAILGVFVAVFSLIISNAQNARELIGSETAFEIVIKAIVASNVSTVFSIACLFLLLKLFLGIKKK